MRTGLPAIISTHVPSAWESCRIIAPNLLHAYQLALGPDGYQIFSYPEKLAREAVQSKGVPLLDLARRIHAARPSRLIFIDHMPHPAPLLMALTVLYGSSPLPPLYFHVYGDFILRSDWWAKLEDTLTQAQLLFICASGRQTNLLSRMFNRADRSVEVCPFAVDTGHYFSSPALRREWRAKLGLNEGEFTLVYSGRLSMQKNVELLIRKVQSFAEQAGVNTRLLLAGRYDDLGAPLFGRQHRRGAMFMRVNEILKAQQSGHPCRVDYIGHVGREELLGIYNAADCYVSMSLHHDEDFGMSPAEALSCGASAVLTSWGGYSGFVSHNSTDCELAPVRLNAENLEIDQTAFFRALLRQSVLPQGDPALRRARSLRYHARFSLQAVAETLRTIGNKPLGPFAGFNPLFNVVAERMQHNSPYPGGPRSGSLYEDVYSAYLK